MSGVFIHGTGAVSPAGWSTSHLMDAVDEGKPLPVSELRRPGWEEGLRIRQVARPDKRLEALRHPRLRRSSPITHYIVSAALEALGGDLRPVKENEVRLGIVLCVMSGCVNYSSRFFQEVLQDPATASPLLFPETVFNAPASHLGTFLNSCGLNYTLVGDPSAYLAGLAMAAGWLSANEVDGALVIAAEEKDWLVADASRIFSSNVISADGAGALYLKSSPEGSSGVRIEAVSSPASFHNVISRRKAARSVVDELKPLLKDPLVFDSRNGDRQKDVSELAAVDEFPRTPLSIRKILGEAFVAASAWQAIAAVESIKRQTSGEALVTVVGCHHQAIAMKMEAVLP